MINNFDHLELLDKYTQVKTCIYKGEEYSVRDNGAVLRHKPESKPKPRPLDEKWTFGRKDINTGYMLIGSHRIHIIVATAFYGENDSSKLVVDHIDTNRCNNRPENLRWLTRLENALMNPVTFRRIEYLCGGDIHKFISDPSCLRDLSGTNQDVMWMRTVTPEEARNAFIRVMEWSQRPYLPTKEKPTNRIDDWIFTPNNGLTEIKPSQEYQDIFLEQSSDQSIQYYDSITPTAKQIDWRTPTEFPLCPRHKGEISLEEYASNLDVGKVVSKNEYGCHFVDDYKLVNDKLYIRTHTSDGIKPFSLITVTLDNDGFYCHEGTTFFDEEGSKKYFTLAIGEEWTGGEVFDDFC